METYKITIIMQKTHMDKITIHTGKAANHTDNLAIRMVKLAGWRKLLIFASVLLLLPAGCVKDDLYNTPHPDKGAVVVTTDWTGSSSDAVLPDDYVLRIGTQEQTVNGGTNVFPALFLPGEQDLLVWHHAEGITISGNAATVNTLPNGTLEPMPGYLFSAAQKLVIAADDTLRVTTQMQQHIRSLTLTLKLRPGDEERLAGTSATLTGITSAVNLVTGDVAAAGGKAIVPVFLPGTDDGETYAAGSPLLIATMRLLGVVSGERQILTLVLTLTDGHVQTITADLTDALKDFNGELEPLMLDATLELPTEAGFEASISDWKEIDNGNIEIH